jgi:hypothetical protein
MPIVQEHGQAQEQRRRRITGSRFSRILHLLLLLLNPQSAIRNPQTEI